MRALADDVLRAIKKSGVAYKALRLHYKLIISGFQGVAL